jgi:hypothetical protein
MTSADPWATADKGDAPITLAEILESIETHPVFVRFLRRRGRIRWHPSLTPPDPDLAYLPDPSGAGSLVDP